MDVEDSPISKPMENDPDLKNWERARNDTISFGRRLASKYSKEGAELEFETAMSAFFRMALRKGMLGELYGRGRDVNTRL